MLKIGELTSGLFAGDKLIAGKEFDWSKLYDALIYHLLILYVVREC